MEPGEFRRLRAEARKRKKSVAELFRSAVRQVYLQPEPEVDRNAVVDRILSMDVGELPGWKKLKEEIVSRHDDLP
jgi:hypothetical protein